MGRVAAGFDCAIDDARAMLRSSAYKLLLRYKIMSTRVSHQLATGSEDPRTPNHECDVSSDVFCHEYGNNNNNNISDNLASSSRTIPVGWKSF
jgi:hypothetical protein